MVTEEKLMWDQVRISLQASMERVVTKVATLLPGILAFAVVMIFFAALAWLLAFLVRKLLVTIRLDERLQRGAEALAEWSPTQTPTKLVTRVVFWLCITAGVLVGLSSFDAAASETGMATYVFAYVPRIIGAVILLFIGNIVARFLSRSVLISAVNMNVQYARLLSTGAKWLVMVLTSAMILDHLAIAGGIVDLAFGILFGGIVLALALAVGLGSRDLVSRSLERESARAAEPRPEKKLHHF
jgi:Conserved TM helix